MILFPIKAIKGVGVLLVYGMLLLTSGCIDNYPPPEIYNCAGFIATIEFVVEGNTNKQSIHLPSGSLFSSGAPGVPGKAGGAIEEMSVFQNGMFLFHADKDECKRIKERRNISSPEDELWIISDRGISLVCGKNIKSRKSLGEIIGNIDYWIQ